MKEICILRLYGRTGHSLDKIPIGENVTGHWRDAGRPYEIELQLIDTLGIQEPVPWAHILI